MKIPKLKYHLKKGNTISWNIKTLLLSIKNKRKISSLHDSYIRTLLNFNESLIFVRLNSWIISFKIAYKINIYYIRR
jgi:hypothetical protein